MADPSLSIPSRAGTATLGTGDAGTVQLQHDRTDQLLKHAGSDGTVRTVVDTTSAQTLTNKTLTSPTITGATQSASINGDLKVLAANAVFDEAATLADLTGFSWTLVAGATYKFRVRLRVTQTTNGGLAVAFKYTTLTLTSIAVQAIQRTASAFAYAASTTTTDQTKFIDQKATAYVDVELEGSLVVNAGGTLAVQCAQNTSHTDETTIHLGSFAEFTRTA